MILTGVALVDPELAPKRELLPSPVPALKETWNGFPREKSFSNTSDLGFEYGWRNTIENGGENATSVTTSHLFWPNQRRNVALPLRFWLPNSDLSAAIIPPRKPWGVGGN